MMTVGRKKRIIEDSGGIRTIRLRQGRQRASVARSWLLGLTPYERALTPNSVVAGTLTTLCGRCSPSHERCRERGEHCVRDLAGR